MTIQIDTTIGNKRVSERLKGMLVDLRNTTSAIVNSIEEIRTQARSEGFEDHETNLLIRSYLNEFLNKRQIKYILKDRLRIKEQKKLTDKQDNSGQIDDKNVPYIPAKVVVPDQVIDEETHDQQKPSVFEEYKPDHTIEDLRAQLENTKEQLNQEREDKKEFEEKYKQLEARTRVLPSNSAPALQQNNLGIKVVVSQIFRDVLEIKGQKNIYANILIDATQNKYIRLEPIPIPNPANSQRG